MMHDLEIINLIHFCGQLKSSSHRCAIHTTVLAVVIYYLLKGGYVLNVVCLSVCKIISNGQIFMKFSGNIYNGARDRGCDCGSVLDHHLDPGIF